MSAKVLGGTQQGGVLVEVPCPTMRRVLVDGRWAFEKCDAELECEQSVGGLWTIPHRCPSCGWLLRTTGFGHQVIKLAQQAVEDYGGPSDSEMESHNSQCLAGQPWL